ncbi:MAG: Cyclic-phosphate processing Receiver domain [Acidobacteriota bacterium]|nr:Cyclic-phosphate processing Receiver domain [Acidobacteriota bacterium]
MGIWQGLLDKLGLGGDLSRQRGAIRVFLLDDDESRHDWFDARFPGDHLDIAVEPRRAIELLSQNFYDAIFLDHDLLPEHYKSSAPDDERTGYAVAAWLAANPHVQPAATIIVHTRNAEAAHRMVREMERGGRRRVEHVSFKYLPEKIKHYWPS